MLLSIQNIFETISYELGGPKEMKLFIIDPQLRREYSKHTNA